MMRTQEVRNILASFHDSESRVPRHSRLPVNHNNIPSFFLGVLLSVAGCDVPVLRPAEQGADAGIAVAATDSVQSANIGLIDGSGRVLSSSVLSTASQKAGFSTALGGDLSFPSTATTSTELVILDRFPSSVITWLDTATARVRAQLSVATGFAANPHDYVPLTADKAWVTRFDSNPNPGRERFDAGGDLLVINPATAEITGRIDVTATLAPVGGYFAHPDRARLLNGRVYVVIPFYDARHRSGDSYVAVLDPDSQQVEDSLLLEGVTGCSGLDIAPDMLSIAVACSGTWQGTGRAQADTSAIVGLEITPQLREIWRVRPGSDTRAYGFTVAFADGSHVIAARLGSLGPPLLNDAVVLIDTHQGTATLLFESAGKPATLNIGPCLAARGECFIADASRSQIVRLDLEPDGRRRLTQFDWLDPVGLPARQLALVGRQPDDN